MVLALLTIAAVAALPDVLAMPAFPLAGAAGAAAWVLFASATGLPVSTTHALTGAIVGAGLRQGRRAVQWGPLASLASAWVVTLPLCAVLGAGAARLAQIAA